MITIDNVNYYDTEEVAEMFKRSSRSVRRFIRSGQLKASKIGKSYYVTLKDIENYINRSREEQ